ncbi:MAG: DUF3575 domain-containing protein [Dysgonamonadaceae bacterium]|nr:DUF3575 domain-containing protein [Dysgonamonadaceae bacterium]
MKLCLLSAARELLPCLQGNLFLVSKGTSPLPAREALPCKQGNRSLNLQKTVPALALILSGLFAGNVQAQNDTLKNVLAVKTNLLYDLALTPNVELEVPIGNRWSINAGFMRGWWLKKDWSFCWQIEAAELETRYWPGNRENKPALNGWFLGAFAGGGFYDFQLKSDHGTQGEFYIMTGLSAGYTHRIGRSLNLEYAVGAGFFTMDYRKYQVMESHHNDAIQRDLIKYGPEKRYSALVPLKIKVALSWTLNKKTKKKGGLK